MSLLEIKHLSKSYEDKRVLNDINLSIDKGDIYGILGLSGAGKSTLVRCINSLEKFDEGEITYDGELLCDSTHPIEREKRRKIGMIFQSFNLLQQKNALENVKLGLKFNHYPKKDIEPLAIEALKRVGLEDKMYAYPSELSGGQQQRVAIARVLALKPEVILSDEATSALDNENTISILNLLKSLNEEYGLTILMISHQLNVIEEICNKVAIIDHSNIIEKGNLSDVFLNPQSEVTRKLVYSSQVHSSLDNHKMIRILFDGNVDEPLISNIVLECNILVSVVYASTKVVEGKAYGQTLIKCPQDEKDIEKLRKYLTLKKIKFEEVDDER